MNWIEHMPVDFPAQEHLKYFYYQLQANNMILSAEKMMPTRTFGRKRYSKA